jgi:hypothetical protein
MARYAEGTTVRAEKTEGEIKALLRKRGADQVMSGTDGDLGALVEFRMRGKHVRFTVRYPSRNAPLFRGARRPVDAWEAEVRRLWRALLLSIKARLELVDSGIESFEVAFLPNFVTPDGRTMADVALPALEAAYATGQMPTNLLQLPSGQSGRSS